MANKSLSGAKFVKYGYGQVEDNHLSAPRNGQVYGQLPAAASIDKLENGQFVKYDYAKGLCTLPGDQKSGNGPVMMVFNEIKIYRDRETEADFAMLKADYNARVYSPIGQTNSNLRTVLGNLGNREGDRGQVYNMQIPEFVYGADMPAGTTMVPRVFKMSVGDIYTTNCIDEDAKDLVVGAQLRANDDGYLALSTGTGAAGKYGPTFQVVKVYTMPDNQPGVKLQCIAE